MRIQIFRAASLQAALEEIRQEMGPDASVLRTRQRRDGWMGWLGRTYVEVTAGISEGSHAHCDASSHEHSQQQSIGSGSSGGYADGFSGNDFGRDVLGPLDVRQTNPRLDRLSDRYRGPETLPMWDASGESVKPRLIEPALPPQLAELEKSLRAAGVHETIVSRWIRSTCSFAANLGDDFPEPWLEHLQRSVAREIRWSGPIRTQPGSRHVVALVGPTGVGKTTTVAKLAAGFRLDSKRRVGLLTIDTFRIAAVEQLRSYADIMDLPMQVVEQPDQMQPALKRLGDVDLVLIDTAGRSPRSDSRIEQLVELLRLAEVDETHLVLSATSSAAVIGSVLQGFSPAHPTSAILTKLDETPCTAAVLSAVTASATRPGMPLSYITNGQQVPDDIAIADATALVSRLLPAPVSLPDVGAA
ncbi:flagellar biosynthesis protein FlhF [Stieleria varia]|uniref:Flagellar biosynthesis protein FlhF n=1 Tax=Stieleria varia TaxID=2528005 RepID=A0A5C6ARH5_9BACT|nr:flagellar biosynthesis protein FlhF [Stieleria varia]TWU00744.1 Flagellar biosynthesis protein FlhF [Stieleria varia]